MSIELLVSDIRSLLGKIGNYGRGYVLHEYGLWNDTQPASVLLTNGEARKRYSYSVSLMKFKDSFGVLAGYAKNFVCVRITKSGKEARIGVITRGNPLDERVNKRFTNPIDIPGKIPLVDNAPFVPTEKGDVDLYEKPINVDDALFIFEGVKKDLEETLRLLKTKGFVYSLPYEFYVHRPVDSRPVDSRPVEKDEDYSSDYEDHLLGIEEVKLTIAVRSRIRIAKFKLYNLKPEAESYLRKTFVCRTEEFKLYVIW